MSVLVCYLAFSCGYESTNKTICHWNWIINPLCLAYSSFYSYSFCWHLDYLSSLKFTWSMDTQNLRYFFRKSKFIPSLTLKLIAPSWSVSYLSKISSMKLLALCLERTPEYMSISLDLLRVPQGLSSIKPLETSFFTIITQKNTYIYLCHSIISIGLKEVCSSKKLRSSSQSLELLLFFRNFPFFFVFFFVVEVSAIL